MSHQLCGSRHQPFLLRFGTVPQPSSEKKDNKKMRRQKKERSLSNYHFTPASWAGFGALRPRHIEYEMIPGDEKKRCSHLFMIPIMNTPPGFPAFFSGSSSDLIALAPSAFPMLSPRIKIVRRRGFFCFINGVKKLKNY